MDALDEKRCAGRKAPKWEDTQGARVLDSRGDGGTSLSYPLGPWGLCLLLLLYCSWGVDSPLGQVEGGGWYVPVSP